MNEMSAKKLHKASSAKMKISNSCEIVVDPLLNQVSVSANESKNHRNKEFKKDQTNDSSIHQKLSNQTDVGGTQNIGISIAIDKTQSNNLALEKLNRNKIKNQKSNTKPLHKVQAINIMTANEVEDTSLNTDKQSTNNSGINNKLSKSNRTKSSFSKSPQAIHGTRNPTDISTINTTSFSFTCDICASENVEYLAIGVCDHPICSKCAVRLRYKGKDKCCVMCKHDLPFMIVYPIGKSKSSNTSYPSFNSFNITSIDTPISGSRVDYSVNMIFMYCHSHFDTIQKLVHNFCEICDFRCRDGSSLQKHMTEKHELQYCQLCFKHMSLFPSELPLYTSADLVKHMNTPPSPLPSHSSSSPASNNVTKQMSESGAKVSQSAGHLICKFCKEYFYDAHYLYIHMRDSHYTCHLCPAKYQHRYYNAMSDIYSHIKCHHHVCNICSKGQVSSSRRDMTNLTAFSQLKEYNEHMRYIHNIMISSNDSLLQQISLSQFHINANKTDFPLYLDLNMSQANPYLHNEEEEEEEGEGGEGRGGGGLGLGAKESGARKSAGNKGKPFTGTASVAGPRIVIPANMKVAGRVTGAGNFHRDASDDVLEQAYTALPATSSTKLPGNRNKKFQEHFPSLQDTHAAVQNPISDVSGSEVTKCGDENEKEAKSVSLHPLSVLNQTSSRMKEKKELEKLKEEKLQKEKLAQERLLRRNQVCY